MIRLTRSLRRCLLSLAAVLLAVLLLVSAVFVPWLERNRQYNEEIAEQSRLVARYQEMLQAMPKLQAELEQVRNDQQLKAFYFSAETRALAGANVQAKIKEIISSSGGSLTSTQLLSRDTGERSQKVGVRVQMRTDTAQLVEVLYQIETAQPLLFIEQVSVRAQARRRVSRRSRRAKKAAVSSPLLTVRLDIFGFVQPEQEG